MNDRQTVRRTLGARAFLAGLLLWTAGCGTTTPTTATGPVTENLSGTVVAGGAAIHAFTVAQTGNFDLVLTSLTPLSSITMGLGIGTPTTDGCGILSFIDNARVGTDFSGTINPGSYCATIYDIGNVQGTVTYQLTFTHP